MPDQDGDDDRGDDNHNHDRDDQSLRHLFTLRLPATAATTW